MASSNKILHLQDRAAAGATEPHPGLTDRQDFGDGLERLAVEASHPEARHESEPREVYEFKRSSKGSSFGPADTETDGWEEAGGDDRYRSTWMRREVRTCRDI